MRRLLVPTGLLSLAVVLFSCTPILNNGQEGDTETDPQAHNEDTIAPGEVAGLTGQARNKEALLTWSDPADEDLTAIEVTWYSQVGDDGSTVIEPGRELLAVSDLENDVRYTFWVSTRDTSDNVSDGLSLSLTPVDALGPADVTALQAQAGNFDVNLIWTDPTDEDFAEVRIWYESSAGCVVSPIIVAPGVEGATLTNLNVRQVAYTITLKTADASGNESPGQSVVVSVAPPPEVAGVSAVSGNAEVILEWEEPQADLAEIVVSWYDGGSREERIAPGAGRFVVTGLQNGRQYIFAVQTVDENGIMSLGVQSPRVIPRRFPQIQKILSDAAYDGNEFGAAVAIDGDHAIVIPNGSRTVQFFHRTGPDNWEAGQILSVFEGLPFSIRPEVALCGDYAIVSALTAQRVIILHRSADNDWSSYAVLAPPDGELPDGFGIDVDIDSDRAVVGAGDSAPNGPITAAAYVYVRTGTNAWEYEAKLSPHPDVETRYFGRTVAIDGDYVVVGDFANDVAFRAGGLAYVFHRVEGSTWDAGVKIVPPDIAEADLFGSAVDICGDYVAVSSPNDEYLGEYGSTMGGAVNVFRRTGITRGTITRRSRRRTDR